MTTVWIYVDTSKQVGDVGQLKVFANPDVADEWLKANDPEGVAFQYKVESASEEHDDTPLDLQRG
jgi:hypothetical protein